MQYTASPQQAWISLLTTPVALCSGNLKKCVLSMCEMLISFESNWCRCLRLLCKCFLYVLSAVVVTILTIHWWYIYFFLWRCDPTRVMASLFLMFLDHTQRRTIVGRTPLDEWSARRRDICLTTHNNHNRQISMPQWDSNPRSQQASGRRPTP